VTWNLNELSVRLFAGWGMPHDYLWFSSTESAQVSTTFAILHGYALTLSLSQRSWACAPPNPDYERDLAPCSYYAVPAAWTDARRVRITQNAIDDRTHRTDSGRGNTPSLSYRVCVAPDPHALRLEAGFRVFVFAFGLEGPPPGVTRLGKKGCAMRWRWTEVADPLARLAAAPLRPSHPVNPLDLSHDDGAISYQPVALPPHLLYQLAELKDEPVVQFDREIVHVPARVLRRAGVPIER
jgi:CRISPR-associated protein Csc1